MFRRNQFNRGFLVFLCAFLLTFPVEALNTSLSGRWVSLQYGSLTFTQNENDFTVLWTGTKAVGTISGRQASFRFWAGASFEKCKDDSRGYGTLALSDDGNTLTGSWANMSKKDPESGSFTAIRVASISGQITQDAAPALEEAPNEQGTVTESAPPDASSTAGVNSQQAATGSQTSEAGAQTVIEPPVELILLPENYPPEYIEPVIEVISDLEEFVLKLFDVFDDDSGDQTDTVPQPLVDRSLLEDASLEDGGVFWDFFVDLWTSVWGQ